jgi:hypothetical protein
VDLVKSHDRLNVGLEVRDRKSQASKPERHLLWRSSLLFALKMEKTTRQVIQGAFRK